MKRSLIFCTLFLFFVLQLCAQVTVMNTQVLVVGGSTGGTAAGIQSARSGATTLIVEQTTMLGGMLTAAAVSCTDGNDGLKSGMWQQLREALYKHYGTTNLASGWVSNTCFEPHVGDSIFKAWAGVEKKLTVVYNWYFDKALMKGNKITGAAFINQKGEHLMVHASIVVDGTDLGDVFASAGAGYDLGMEAPGYSGEKEAIEKNNIIQDLTWSAILKDYGKGADKTIKQPAGYDASKYYCSTSDAPCTDKPYQLDTRKVLNYGKLTVTDTLHSKFMLNWPVHGNDAYLNVVERKPVEREIAYSTATNQTLGFIYFLQHQLGFKNIGLADDEVNNGMAWLPYNREGRRVKGVVRLNINHIKKPYQYDLYKTGIAVGDYPVDHHHGQYPGKVPAIQFPKVPSFTIPLGALIPSKMEGLIICEKGISVSNIANGTTRLQPVVLLTGQAAGVLAAQCIAKKIQPGKIDVRAVQNELLKMKCYLLPFCDVDPNEASWNPIQQAGALGLIRGVGKSIDWENKTFFYPDSTIKNAELENNLNGSSGKSVKDNQRLSNDWLTIQQAKKMIGQHAAYPGSIFYLANHKNINEVTWKDKLHLTNYNEQRFITRRELAVLLMYYAKGFINCRVDLFGKRLR
ncbi:FAD-dependent oxidoreductase [Ferruginibacter paludis]|uniref:FAD-dependent oxidoreductase n=1 Tax=Ferruginibacter paludis TaxID=1310417 RepID=UPI0025B55FBE|nr:FAD-dependent oxidoreductase [Ferruginibacter paludis]MDN3656836.1 FAD-dependent oxidoreductase [Ferruginibacter paludis]